MRTTQQERALGRPVMHMEWTWTSDMLSNLYHSIFEIAKTEKWIKK